jgi:hypothetical protein
VIINLKATTDTAGLIGFNDLNIEYDYTIKVTGSSTGKSLAEEMVEFTSSPDEGNDTIPFYIQTSTGGKFVIRNITIEYNDYPEAYPIEGFELDEDTTNETLIDLSKFFSDDTISSTSLFYEIVNATNGNPCCSKSHRKPRYRRKVINNV